MFTNHYPRVFAHCTVGNYQVYNWSLGMMTERRMVFAINITRQWADHTAPRCPGDITSVTVTRASVIPGPDNEKIEQKTETCHRFHTDWTHYPYLSHLCRSSCSHPDPWAGVTSAAAGQLTRPQLFPDQLKIIQLLMISFYWFEIDMEWSWAIIYNLSWEEVLAGDERKEDAGVWNLISREFNKLLSKSLWRVILQSEKAEKCLYNFCSSISCGFVLSLFELSEGVMLYLHGICNTEGLEAFSICFSLFSRELDILKLHIVVWLNLD